MKNQGSICFEAYDKDVAGSDFLGATEPCDFVDLVADESVREFDAPLLDKKGKRAGNVKFAT